MLKSVLKRSRAYYRIDPAFSVCPSCKNSDSIKRSHSRNFKEKMINRLSFSKYYRCKKCGWRGTMRTVAVKSNSFLTLLFYFLLVAFASLLTYLMLKRLL